MTSFTCPYCYGIHDVVSCDLKCSYYIPGNKDANCVYGDLVKKDGDGWIPSRAKMQCLRCEAAKKTIYCSIAKKEIPSDFLNGKNLSIALIGAKASGKSNYIGVLVNEIKKKMSASFNCILNLTASEESKLYYDDYYALKLFKDGEVVEATDKIEIPPLIFPLRFMDKKNKIRKVAALTFYDTAGENLDSTEDILINNRYIPNADGIILLLDPLQIPAIREKLKGKIALPAQNTDTVEILSRIVQNIRDVKNVKGSIKTPLALVFTKIDVLEQFGVLREDSCLKEESEHLKSGVFVESDFESVNVEIQDLLENWLDSEILQQVKNFKTYSFFGVTALGGVPTGGRLHNGKVNPRRVLDPLLWILAMNKYIKTSKR